MRGTKARLPLCALTLFVLLVVPVAIAGAAGGSVEPQAKASASVKKKLKKLKRQVGELEARLAAVEGEQGHARPPSGNAGGDLAGSYPNPSIDAGAVNSGKVANNSLTALDIGLNAVGAGEVQDPTRSVNLPVGSFVDWNIADTIDFTQSNGTAPDFSAGNAVGIAWDADVAPPGGADVADTNLVASTFTVPPDYASGGSFALRVGKSGHTGIGERLTCNAIVNNGPLGGAAVTTTTTFVSTSYTVTPPESYASGDSVTVICKASDTATDGNAANDAVFLHSIEFRYTATQ